MIVTERFLITISGCLEQNVLRMKEKAFAASVRRESILECELIGIPMADFAQLSIDALVPIEVELGF